MISELYKYNIMSLYNNLSKQFYGAYNKLYASSSIKYYLSYGCYLGFACAPKLSYQNQYEPEYTKNTVKYNAPIVAAMLGTTLYLIQ